MKLIAGLDEVGMGSLAGPVVVVVVAFPASRVRIAGVADSKKLSWMKLNKLAPTITKEAAWIGYGFASPQTIDELGMSASWELAANMALKNCPSFDLLVVDGNRGVGGYRGKQEARPRADATQWQVSAASIIAKVMRDNDMIELAEHYPEYGWTSNVGYGTDEHRAALQVHGATPHHRKKYTDSALNGKKKDKKPSRFRK